MFVVFHGYNDFFWSYEPIHDDLNDLNFDTRLFKISTLRCPPIR